MGAASPVDLYIRHDLLQHLSEIPKEPSTLGVLRYINLQHPLPLSAVKKIVEKTSPTKRQLDRTPVVKVLVETKIPKMHDRPNHNFPVVLDEESPGAANARVMRRENREQRVSRSWTGSPKDVSPKSREVTPPTRRARQASKEAIRPCRQGESRPGIKGKKLTVGERPQSLRITRVI